MLQIILPIVFILFGIFLKKTTSPGFRNSKKLSNVFIILGISTLVAKMILIYIHSR